MMGRPWQKCRTSEIHCSRHSLLAYLSGDVPPAESNSLALCRFRVEEEGLTDLLLNVVQGIRRVDSEADKNHVGVGVGQGTETIVVLLASRIPKCQLDVLAVDLDVGDIVLENGGDIDLQPH
jgi:hypothetical protein